MFRPALALWEISVDVDSLVKSSGEWLRGTGPESDIVVSSRIRLARNLAQFPFPQRSDDSTRTEIVRLMRDRIDNLDDTSTLHWFDVASLDDLDRQFLVERQLISRELAEGRGQRGVCVSREQHVSLMVNEEDHLRMQVLHSGFSLDES